MIKQIMAYLLLLILMSCGQSGGKDPKPSVGQFVDSPVAGLSYTCGTYTGTTNTTGQFNFAPGNSCTFSVGNITVGSLASIPTDGVVTPQDAAGVARTATSDPGATAIAQFLQSIGTSSGGVIAISSTTAQSLTSLPATNLVSSTGAISQSALANIVSNVPGATFVVSSKASSVLATQIQAAGINTSVGVAPAGSAPKLDAITVSAPSTNIASGIGVQLSASGNYTDGTTTSLTNSVTWSSSNTSVINVSSSGVATGIAPGTANVIATSSNGVIGSTALTITPATLVSITVSSSATSIPSGLTMQMVATGTFTDNSTSTLTSGVNWSSSNNSTTISSGGIVTGKSVGTSTITASVGSVSGSTTISVSKAVLQSIVIAAPSGVTSAPVRLAEQLTALGTYSDNTTVNLANLVTWTSNNNASVNSSGVLSGIAIGTASITASYGVVSGSFSLPITAPELISISITAITNTNAPTASSAPAGYAQQLKATGIYNNNTTQNITTSAIWTSASQGVATVTTGSAGGLVNAVSQGTSVITATLGGVSQAVTFTVNPPILLSIAVSAPQSSDYMQSSENLIATGTYSDNSTQNITNSVTWSTSNLSTSSISSTGVLTGISNGTTNVTASLSGISSPTTSINIGYPLPPSISLPTSITPIGSTATFNVTLGSTSNAYWVALPSSASAPTAAQVIAGTDGNNSSFVLSGNQSIAANSATSISIFNLLFNTTYNIYFVATSYANVASQSSVKVISVLPTISPTLTTLVSGSLFSGSGNLNPYTSFNTTIANGPILNIKSTPNSTYNSTFLNSNSTILYYADSNGTSLDSLDLSATNLTTLTSSFTPSPVFTPLETNDSNYYVMPNGDLYDVKPGSSRKATIGVANSNIALGYQGFFTANTTNTFLGFLVSADESQLIFGTLKNSAIGLVCCSFYNLNLSTNTVQTLSNIPFNNQSSTFFNVQSTTLAFDGQNTIYDFALNSINISTNSYTSSGFTTQPIGPNCDTDQIAVDGPLGTATIINPTASSFYNNAIYFIDNRSAIRKLDLGSKTISTIAGTLHTKNGNLLCQYPKSTTSVTNINQLTPGITDGVLGSNSLLNPTYLNISNDGSKLFVIETSPAMTAPSAPSGSPGSFIGPFFQYNFNAIRVLTLQ